MMKNDVPDMNDQNNENETATIYIMGERYEVPASLTIMQALEYSGYRLVRGCGCRGGFCGACTTLYRIGDDYKLYIDLACQKQVEDKMYLVQLPFVPAEKPEWDIEKMDAKVDDIISIYPEITRCVSCNACTKACPQSLEVMRAIQAIRRGELEKVANLTFDCISCGACSVRCPAEITHQNVFQLVRRLYGKYIVPKAKHLEKRAKEIKEHKYDDAMEKLIQLTDNEKRELYSKVKPANASEAEKRPPDEALEILMEENE